MRVISALLSFVFFFFQNPNACFIRVNLFLSLSFYLYLTLYTEPKERIKVGWLFPNTLLRFLWCGKFCTGSLLSHVIFIINRNSCLSFLLTVVLLLLYNFSNLLGRGENVNLVRKPNLWAEPFTPKAESSTGLWHFLKACLRLFFMPLSMTTIQSLLKFSRFAALLHFGASEPIVSSA